MDLSLIFLIAAFIVFAIVAWLEKSLLAVGLALWVLAELLPKVT
jgi:hypothetical protein